MLIWQEFETEMKIFFDATSLCWGYSGIPVYVRQILRQLAVNPEIDLHFGLKSASLKSHCLYRKFLAEILGDKIEYHRILLPGRLGWHSRLLHKYFSFNARKYDLMFYPALFAPCCAAPSDFSNTILTVHDMFPFHKDNHNEDAVLNNLLKSNLPWQSEQAMAIFTDSEFSKKEINKYLGISLEKIYAIPLAAQWSDCAFIPSDILQKNSLSARSYFLAVSTLLPHKNYITLFTAFKKYQQSTNYAGEKLVVVGKRKEQFKDICDALDTTPNVIHLQNIPENDLRTLYENSKGFFLVSKLEGFGIPLLEAMSCKVPACYGKGSSMDEIGRDAAYGVDPNDIDGIAETFGLFSAGGKGVDHRVEQAYNISQEYSYEKTANIYIHTYKKLLNRQS